MIILVIVVMLLVFVGNGLIDMVNESSIKVLKKQYGSWHFAKFNLTENEKTIISSDNSINRLGYIRIFGNYSINKSRYYVTVGTIDDIVKDIGNLTLNEGRYPDKKGEICLENHFRYLFEEELKTGDLIKLYSEEGTFHEYKVTGFIDDYQTYWNGPDEIKVGENDYPGGIVCDGEFKSRDEKEHAIVLFKTSEENMSPVTMIASLGKKLGSYDNIAINTNAYDIEYRTIIYPVQMYKRLFTFLYVIVASILFYYSEKQHLLSYKNDYQLYQSFGIRNISLWFNAFVILAFPIFTGIIIGALLSFVLGIIISNDSALIIITYSVLVVLGVFLISSFFVITGERLKPRKKVRKAGDFDSSFVLEMSAIGIKKKIVSSIILILILSIAMVSFYCVDFHKEITINSDTEDYYSLSGSSFYIYTEVFAAGMPIRNRQVYYVFDNVKRLVNVMSEKGYYLNYESYYNSSLCVDGRGSDYWEYIETLSPNSEYAGTDFYLKASEVESIPDENIYIPYSYFTITDRNIESFKKQFPDIDIENDLAKGKVIMYLPPLKRGDEKVIRNDILAEGKPLLLSSISFDGDFNQILEEKEKIKYFSNKVVISKIFEDSFSFKDEHTYIYPDYTPRIIWTEETAHEYGYFQGISNISVYVPKSIPEDDYEEVKRLFERVALSSKSGNVSYSKFYIDFYDTLFNTIDKVYLTIVILSSVAMIVSVSSIISGSLNENRISYGVMRSFGMKKSQLYRMIFIEWFIYWMISLIFISITTAITVYLFSSSLGQIVRNNQQFRYAITTFFIHLILLGTIASIVYLFVNKLFGEDISNSIRHTE